MEVFKVKDPEKYDLVIVADGLNSETILQRLIMNFRNCVKPN